MLVKLLDRTTLETLRDEFKDLERTLSGRSAYGLSLAALHCEHHLEGLAEVSRSSEPEPRPVNQSPRVRIIVDGVEQVTTPDVAPLALGETCGRPIGYQGARRPGEPDHCEKSKGHEPPCGPATGRR